VADKNDGLFAVLRYPAFRWIWAGALVSNVGNWMEAVAQGWLVQQQTASPFMVELLAASEFVPHALLLLAAGALADRYDRRKLLVFGQSVMMVFAAVLAVAAHLGLASPWVVIAIAFLEGAAWASVTPAWQALVPALVPRDELPAAIALNWAQFNVARLLGPMLAGVMLSAASAAVVFDFNVASFIGIVLVLVLVTLPSAELQRKPAVHSDGVKPAFNGRCANAGRGNSFSGSSPLLSSPLRCRDFFRRWPTASCTWERTATASCSPAWAAAPSPAR